MLSYSTHLNWFHRKIESAQSATRTRLMKLLERYDIIWRGRNMTRSVGWKGTGLRIESRLRCSFKRVARRGKEWYRPREWMALQPRKVRSESC